MSPALASRGDLFDDRAMVGSVEGSLTLTASDLDRARADNPVRSPSWFLLLIGIPGLVRDGPYLFRELGKASVSEVWSNHTLRFVGALSGALLVVLWITMRWFARGKQQVAQLGSDALDVSYHFDDQGVRISTRKQDLALGYAALTYVDGKSSFVLYHGWQQQVVPKRAFSSDQVEQITAWLERNSKRLFQMRWTHPALIIGLVIATVVALVLGALSAR